MKLWLLERSGVDYDEYDAFVIRAKTEKRAREIANERCGDEGAVWTDKKVSCTFLHTIGEEGIILGSFNAG